jgi:hypothetical protein
MKPRGLLLWTLSLWAFLASQAQAHFLFIRIGPPAEAGRAAEVFFSEQAEAGDPRFIDKIAHTQLWLQKTPGKFEELKVVKGSDRLRAHLPMSGSLAVAGTCQYGVLARPNQAPFLLRYYPKAVAGKPADLKAMKAFDKIPLEIMATADGDRITFTALLKGKPLPQAVFHTVDSNLISQKLQADANGRATWKPAAGDRYAVYTRHVTREAGQADGKEYEEIREFATIAFAWPLAPKGPEPKAVALFEEALATRAQWKDFPGFSARIKGKVDGRPFEGAVTIDAKGSVQLQMDDKGVRSWVEDQLESIVLHRAARAQKTSSTEKRSKPVLRFGDEEEDHPLGRLLIFEGGRFASSYRVKDKQLTVVNRHLGRLNMTITVLDNEKNGDGLFLPRSYTVQYWDAATGDLRRTEAIQERWLRVGAWDLPAVHTVTTASGAGLSVRSFSLSKHQLLKKK